ncbi:MAG: 16S rRNA (cytosine(967)-C(5))-methyltransferase [Synechococcales cyanobacterium]
MTVKAETTPRGGSRFWALQVLRTVDQRGSLVNLALQSVLGQIPSHERALTTELVYGITRHQRTLDALIEQFSQRPIQQQPPLLRRLLHLGLYQLRHLSQVPAAIAVSSTVDLARQHHLGRLSGVVNGVLRNYLRDPELHLDPQEGVARLGLTYSYPDWLIQLWAASLPLEEVEALCQYFNHVPSLDLRVNLWRTTRESVQAQLAHVGIPSEPWPSSRTALRVTAHHGDPSQWPGLAEGHWSVQDSSAQQVVEWLDPQPGELIIDGCAAPGGKTGHLGEAMHNQGRIIALDHHAGRLRRVRDHAERLGLTIVHTQAVTLGDPQFDPLAQGLPAWGSVDRVLLDVPCSGLGTLHRHADGRWRQSPETWAALLPRQAALLEQAHAWLKPGGTLVYATCTLNPAENEQQIARFGQAHPDWTVETQTIWPHRHQQDGFFMAKLRAPD